MRRLVWLISIFIFWGAKAQVSILSYNIRYDTKDDKENAWPNRKDAIADSLTALSPDILCFQEVLKNQYKFLAKKLRGYGCYGAGRTNGKRKGEYCPVFFRKDKFRLLDKGTFWLSETPDKPSKGWDADSYRIVTWIKVMDISTRKILFVFNTHFDNAGKQAQIESARLLVLRTNAMSGIEHCLVAGDFNITEEMAAYKYMVSANFIDAFKRSTSLVTNTFTGFKTDKAKSKRIDYFFYKIPLKPILYQALSWLNTNGSFLSDHRPVYVEFILE